MKRLMLLLGLLSQQVMADTLSWHGFVSQGLTQSVDSNFITDNNDITGELTELGLNGRWQIKPSLALVGQVNYLDGGNRYKSATRLDYLFLDWQMPEMWQWRSHIHLGRFKNRHWLVSATRDVPMTRSTAILPQSVYFDGFRDIALGSDGVLVQSTHTDDNGIWELNWSIGEAPINQGETGAFLGQDAKGEVEQEYVHQASVYYQPPSMDWRLGVSWLDSEFSYNAAPDEFFVNGKSQIERLMLSGIYFAESWEFSAELVREDRTDTGVYGPQFSNRQVGQGGYVQARYLLNNKVSLLASYDTYELNKDDPDGRLLEAASGGLIPSYYGYQDTVAVGVRWDPAPNWRLQAEHHWVDGAARSTALLIPQQVTLTQKHWRMWAVQLMYWF
ncbi:porin family protein [Salinimonas lutimaris]|uniref:hypothetical protein n=1 Tax=Salinimonas lutimaris TaxID=914153 RepID=UPI001E2B50D6|nr:hypothetical protein [Salinimonas lutimaris]